MTNPTIAHLIATDLDAANDAIMTIALADCLDEGDCDRILDFAYTTSIDAYESIRDTLRDNTDFRILA